MDTSSPPRTPPRNSIPTAPPTPPETPATSRHEYLGHPQPSIGQRLAQAKGFLADEDPSRFLDFEAKIKEIEDYVTYIVKSESQSLDSESAILLQDVKTMVAAHRDWTKRQNESSGPILTHPCETDTSASQLYSKRLVSIDTLQQIDDEMAELDLDCQIRKDGAVFSPDGVLVYQKFMKKMEEDAGLDPIDMDASTNLACIENRAYNWAKRDPALIHHWMHPTRGIPNKPLGLLDAAPWYKDESRSLSTAIRNRPARTWLPDYLKKREDRINELLQIPSSTDGQFDELERLLRYHEPPALMMSHEAVLQMTVLQDWGYPILEETLENASNLFGKQYAKWVATFRQAGVQLMLKPRGSAVTHSHEPGLFYVEDGLLDESRQNLLSQANAMLQQYQQGKAWKTFSDTEQTIFNSLLDHSTPSNIVQLQQQGCRIIQRYKGEQKTVDEAYQDLDWIQLSQEIERLQKIRRKKLKISRKVFRYIRPGQILDSGNDDLYLPWDRTRLVVSDVYPPLPRVEPTAAIIDLEQAINLGFQEGLSTVLEDGNLTLLLMLQQVAYPELRALLIPFLDLCSREIQQGITNTEIAILGALRPIVHNLWNHWIHGFTVRPGVKKVTVVLPGLIGQPERPDLIYCRSKDPNHRPANCEANLSTINTLLQMDLEKFSEAEKVDHFNKLSELFPPDHRYPCLNISWNGNSSPKPEETHSNKFRFDQWMISKSQHTLSMHRYIEHSGPDDDPTVVYYRGPLPTFSELRERMPVSRLHEVESLGVNDRVGWLEEDYGFNYVNRIREDLPVVLLDQLNTQRPEGQLPRIKALMNWFVYEIGNKNKNSSPLVTDYLPPGTSDDGEDGIDDTNIIIDKKTKHRAKHELQIRRAIGAKKATSKATPRPPIEHNRYLHVAQNDIYVETRNGISTLVPLGKLVMTVQVELNRLLRILNNPSTLTNVYATQLSVPDKDRVRLYHLLPQFMPQNVYEKWMHYQSFMDKQTKQQGPSTDTFVSERRLLEDEYSDEFIPWLRALTDAKGRGVSIIVPKTGQNQSNPGVSRVYHGDSNSTNLYFQSRAFDNLGVGDMALKIIAPEVDKESYKNGDIISNAHLVEFSLTKFDQRKKNMAPIKPIPRALSRALDDLEREVNSLLKMRPNLGWEDSERLIECLRIIMPIDMVDRDEFLLVRDNAARTATDLSTEDTAEFWDLWGDWEVSYGTWLKSLPDEIHIDRGTSNDSKFASSMRFATNSSSAYAPRLLRERVLPRPVQEIRDELVEVLQSPREPSDLSDDTWVFLRTALRPLYHKKALKLRRVLEQRIKDSTRAQSTTSSVSVAVLSPEDNVSIEVTLDIAYIHFICEVLEASSSQAYPAIRVAEPSPGRFKMSYLGPTTIHDLTPNGQQMVDILWLKGLDPALDCTSSKARFLDIAGRIRKNIPLNQGEVMSVQDHVRPLPLLRQRMADLGAFVQVLDDTGDLPKGDREAYCKVETSLLWNRWLCDYPSLAEKVCTREQVSKSVDDLLNRPLTGTERYPPVIPPPSEVEVNKAEVEINNLLMKVKKKTATAKEVKQFDYLLIALLPERLRRWKHRLDSQEEKYLAQGGLDTRHTFEFLAREHKFKAIFDKFKAEIPRYGIMLNYNWFSYLAICELCSRSRTWKKHIRYSDDSDNHVMTSNVFEDFEVRIWRQQYTLLEKSVDKAWKDDEDLRGLFLRNSMPQELRDLKDFLEDPTKPPQFKNVFSDRTHPLLTRSHFMQQYMCWLSEFSPNQIKRMRDEAGKLEGQYDYTSMAERRGIQRASVELALNHLATNQEQHRPGSRFRTVDICGQLFVRMPDEVPLCLALEPSKRPLEQDPFEYTKKLAIYRQRKDLDYYLARDKNMGKSVLVLETPANYLGPIALADGDTFKDGSRQIQTHLISVALIMQEAQLKAPRPLMQHLLSRFSDGLNPTNHQKQNGNYIFPLQDDVVIMQRDLDLLSQLAGDSWDELRQDFLREDVVRMTDVARAQFQEFVNEINTLGDLIPTWIAPQAAHRQLDLSDEHEFLQPQHDPSYRAGTQGIAVTRLMLILNQRRQSHDPPLTLWTRRQIYELLRVMHNAAHIFFHGTPQHGQNILPEDHQRVWRIPFTGHPENKYVTTPVIDPDRPTPGVRFQNNGLAVVTYDADGTEGPPIEMPRKFELLQRLAYRLGRDCRRCLETATNEYKPIVECLGLQLSQMELTVGAMKKVTDEDRADMNPAAEVYEAGEDKYALKILAVAINKVAPDLAREAEIMFPSNDPTQMNNAQAAQILQMQIIEEVSNNWELRFPENEHVWNFAEDRLKKENVKFGECTLDVKPNTKQFFNMQRFPVCCQSEEIQSEIVESGPVIQEKPVPEEPTQELTRVERRAQATLSSKPPPKKDRHIKGQRPHFPFGETSYQAAFHSFRIEQDLKDVPEFQPPKKPLNLIPRFLRKRKHDHDDDMPAPKRFGLPDLPPNWEPDSISRAAKKAQMIELAKRTPGMPDCRILEHYHTQAQIEGIHQQEAWNIHCQRVEIANRAIENLTGKMVKELTPAELNKARMELKIDLTHGTMRNLPDPGTVKAAAAALPATMEAESSTRPGIGGASKPSGFAASRAARRNFAAPAPVNASMSEGSATATSTRGAEEGSAGDVVGGGIFGKRANNDMERREGNRKRVRM